MLKLLAYLCKRIIDFVGDFFQAVFGVQIFRLDSISIVRNLSGKGRKELEENLDLLDGLTAYCEGYNNEKDIGVTGRYLMNNLAQQNLQVRGDVLQYIDEHPEINDVPVQRPVFIVTLPRTGSTYLHCLMSTDKRWWVPEYWQMAEPLPVPEWPRNEMDKERISKFQTFIDVMSELAGADEVKRSHSVHSTDPEDLMMMLTRSMIYFIPFAYESTTAYRNWLQTRPDGFWEHAYKLVRKELQMALSAKGVGGRRVLAMNHICFSNPTALLDAFPDAQLIHIHRDPAKLVPSFCSLCRTLNATFRKASDEDGSRIIGQQMTDLLENSAKSLIQLRQTVPNININIPNKPQKFIDVDYERLLDDPIGILKNIYEEIDMEWTEECELGFQKFIDDHPRNKFGSHIYTCQEFNLNEEDIRRRFALYMDLFGVRSET